jgi:hypothetical protein
VEVRTSSASFADVAGPDAPGLDSVADIATAQYAVRARVPTASAIRDVVAGRVADDTGSTAVAESVGPAVLAAATNVVADVTAVAAAAALAVVAPLSAADLAADGAAALAVAAVPISAVALAADGAAALAVAAVPLSAAGLAVVDAVDLGFGPGAVAPRAADLPAELAVFVASSQPAAVAETAAEPLFAEPVAESVAEPVFAELVFAEPVAVAARLAAGELVS